VGDARERQGRYFTRDLRYRQWLVAVVRVFIKKAQKMPQREIDLALERAKEVNP